jgi:hypothetical protein
MEPIMRTPTFSAPDLVSQKPETGPTDRDFQALLSCGIKSPIHLSLTVLGHTFPKWIRLGGESKDRTPTVLCHQLRIGHVPSWLALFPALSDVEFSGFCLSSLENLEARAKFMRAISRASASIGSVKIGFFRANIPEWLEIIPG